jgi:hypothetical protein
MSASLLHKNGVEENSVCTVLVLTIRLLFGRKMIGGIELS